MAQAKITEGTGDELRRLLAKHPHDRFCLIPLTTSDAGEQSSQISLADIFVGRVGIVHGGGTAWSENTGKAFADGMVQKYGPDKDKSES